MFSMWWVMMVAMMLPSATPMLLIFARVSRRERAAERPWVPTGIFASGYLAAWAGFSAAAVALQWGLEESATAVGNDGDHHGLARRRDPDRRRALADSRRSSMPACASADRPSASWPPTGASDAVARSGWGWRTVPIAWDAAGS